MIWFPRRIGPPKPSRIGLIWTAMLKAGSIRQWAMILGAIPMTFVVGVIIYIVKDKSWGQPVLQLNILANLGYGPLIIIAIIFAALTGTSIAANVGKGGAGISLKQDDEDDAPKTVAVSGDLTITPEKTP
jgi:hypothetical protein